MYYTTAARARARRHARTHTLDRLHLEIHTKGSKAPPQVTEGVPGPIAFPVPGPRRERQVVIVWRAVFGPGPRVEGWQGRLLDHASSSLAGGSAWAMSRSRHG